MSDVVIMDLKSLIKSSMNTTNKHVSCNLGLVDTIFQKKEKSSDPLETIKQDPAVLKAFVIVDKKAPSEPVQINQNEKPSTKEQPEPRKPSSGYTKMLAKLESSLLSLTPDQFELLMQYTKLLRIERDLKQQQVECAFCKKNGESRGWYSSHILRDRKGRVKCPILRGLRCPRCGATGDYAHTIKYCPKI